MLITAQCHANWIDFLIKILHIHFFNNIFVSFSTMGRESTKVLNVEPESTFIFLYHFDGCFRRKCFEDLCYVDLVRTIPE